MKQNFNRKIEDLSTEELQRILDSRNNISSEQFLIIKRELKLRTTIDIMVNNEKSVVNPKKIRNKTSKKINSTSLFFELNKGTLTVYTIVILGLISLYVLKYSSPIKTNSNLKYNRSTIGTIERIEYNNGWEQSFEGGKEITVSCTLFYMYTVDDSLYRNHYDIINRSANLKYINFFKENIGKENLSIKYQNTSPEKSTIIIPLL